MSFTSVSDLLRLKKSGNKSDENAPFFFGDETYSDVKIRQGAF
jgi:hypothetical protein